MVIQVSLAFASLPDMELDNFTGNVLTKLTGNPKFPALPTDATLAMLDAALETFTDDVDDAEGGGKLATETKKLARQELLKILRKIAGYVQITSGTREDVLSAGFDTRSTNRARVPLDKPEAVMVKNGVTAQLIAALNHPVKNTSMYEGRASSDGGQTWMTSVFTGDSRHIIFNGLTPGQTYTIQVRAMGGSTGHSDWSDPVSHMSL
jgi:hypothetical protein